MITVRVANDETPRLKIKKASRALIIDNNKVAILYSKKYDFHMTPGGGFEHNETAEEACIREAKEETGLLVKPLTQFALLDADYDRIRIQHHYYICEVIENDSNIHLTDDELDQDLELRWMTYEEVKHAFACIHPLSKYDLWMQREAIILSNLKPYLAN